MTMAMRLIQQHNYVVHNIEVNDIFNLSFDEMYLCAVTEHHCIGVWKNQIYDSSHNQVMALTRTNLNWCCGYSTFTYVKEAWMFKPSVKLTKTIEKSLKTMK